MSANQHITVLLQEAVDALITKPDGCYVDGTYGRGGHSRAILERLDGAGRLLVIDKDPVAIAHAQENLAQDARVTIGHASFAELETLLANEGLIGKVDGILLDLGVSSPQLDDPQRGFSFTRDGPLDMRMNPAAGQSAADWLAVASEQEMADVIKSYGEERYARRIAKAIAAAREQRPLRRTVELAELVAKANPAWEKGKHPATRTFQAIRIFINRELDDLSSVLDQALAALAVGGRLVVISFHSLEDRLVKRFIREQERGPELPRYLPITADQIPQRMRHIGKALKAPMAEVQDNVRARSAVMRVAEKLV